MKTLHELLQLQEAMVPAEVKDVVAAFPKHHEKAIQALLRKRRLTWHGMPLLDDDSVGDAYQKIQAAAEELFHNEKIQEHISISLDPIYEAGEDEDIDDYLEVDFECVLKKHDSQEVYLGYLPKRDSMIIGFDVWASAEEEFWEAFEDAFKKTTGKFFKDTKESHKQIAIEANKELQQKGHYGVAIAVDSSMNADFELAPIAGGFYGSNSCYEMLKRRHRDLADIRLD